MKLQIPLIATAAVTLLPTALAWGAAGHEIVATIAQIHLHPEVKAELCNILPEAAHCHLAPVAAWADTIRRRYPETGPMHYVNPKNDNPGRTCTYGQDGWINEDVNVLTAIMNKTQVLTDNPNDIDLRFLIHFMGDLHQPLHLTGRDKGGNGALFRFEGRVRNLHSVWDSGIILKNIRELSNYTTPVPNPEIEAALPGAIFDPYVRWIVWEGIKDWWRDDVDSWIACPAGGDPYPHSSNGAYPLPGRKSHKPLAIVQSALDLVSGAASFLPAGVHAVMEPILPRPPAPEGFADKLLSAHPDRLTAAGETFEGPVCPYTWSKELHGLNCHVAWPKEYEGSGHPLIELDTPEYLGHIAREKVLERLLALGGLRLAKVLNEVVGKGKFSSIYYPY